MHFSLSSSFSFINSNILWIGIWFVIICQHYYKKFTLPVLHYNTLTLHYIGMFCFWNCHVLQSYLAYLLDVITVQCIYNLAIAVFNNVCFDIRYLNKQKLELKKINLCLSAADLQIKNELGSVKWNKKEREKNIDGKILRVFIYFYAF